MVSELALFYSGLIIMKVLVHILRDKCHFLSPLFLIKSLVHLYSDLKIVKRRSLGNGFVLVLVLGDVGEHCSVPV